MHSTAFTVSAGAGGSCKPMLYIGLKDEEPIPSASSCKLLSRKLAKDLGVSPKHFIRLYNTRTPEGALPLLALDLEPFEHLSAASAVRKARKVVDEYAPRLKTVRSSSHGRKRKEKQRPTNRTSLIRARRALAA